MTTLEHGFHAVKKKGYAPHYIPANLALFQPEIHTIMLKLVDVSSSSRCSASPKIESLLSFLQRSPNYLILSRTHSWYSGTYYLTLTAPISICTTPK